MIYDLDEISISPRIHAAWLVNVPLEVDALMKKFKDLAPPEIVHHQFRVKNDGSGGGQIFLKIRDHEIALNVPANEWEVRYPELDEIVQKILEQPNLPKRLHSRGNRFRNGDLGLASKIRLLQSEGYKIVITIIPPAE